MQLSDMLKQPRGCATLPLDNSGEAATATLGAPTAAPVPGAAIPANLLSLSDVLMNLALGFLDSNSLSACQACCRVVRSAAESDDLWKAKCLEDWGEERKVSPNQRSSQSRLPTYLVAWRAWRRAFDGYRAADVKRVGVWWAGVEAWMSVHLPEIMETINIGVSEEVLDQAEETLGWPLPVHLRLLYRFHNGQWLPWDEGLNASIGVDEGRPAVLPKVAGSGISLGLLGGYCFYHNMATSKLFSLQRGVLAGLATTDAFDGENHGYFAACANRWGTNLETVRSRGGFLLAAGRHMNKRIWVGRDGNVRFDGKATSLMGVFDGAPVVPPPSPDDAAPSSGDAAASSSASVDGAAGAAGSRTGEGPRGNLMVWLEEYLRRLEGGIYGVKSRWREPMRVAGEALPRMHEGRGVWLFPGEGGEGCVTAVTQGVEIQAAPIFIPEECSDRTDLMWAYTVRMKLLEDHPSRPRGMSSCQLSARHWEIDGPEGFHREVSGDGVIGEYPLLTVAAPASGDVPGDAPGGADSRAFEYESCTTIANTPGTMGGYLSFTPGTLDSPRGATFDARVPTFELVEPTFIF